MTSALFLASRRAAKSQSVRRYLNNIKLHGNLERRARQHFICALCSTPFWLHLWVSDCGTEFFIAQAFCWDCIAWIVSTHPPPPHPTVQARFIYLPCLAVRQGEHAWLCPGSKNVTGWQTGECGQTFVVSRRRPWRLSWSQGKLVLRETHCKLIMVVLCGRHVEVYCERGQNAHVLDYVDTYTHQKHCVLT